VYIVRQKSFFSAEAVVLENRLAIQTIRVRKDRNVAYLPLGILIAAMSKL